jgi:hypothetical protein
VITQKYKRYARQCRVRTRSIEYRAHSSRFSRPRALKAPSRAPGRSTHRRPPRGLEALETILALGRSRAVSTRAASIERANARERVISFISTHPTRVRASITLAVDVVPPRGCVTAETLTLAIGPTMFDDASRRARDDAVANNGRDERSGCRSFFRFARSLARTPCFLCLRRRRETDERRRDGERRVRPSKRTFWDGRAARELPRSNDAKRC